MDGCSREKPLLLFFRKHLLFALKILAARRFAEGRIQVFQMVGLELLHLHIADVRNNEVLDRSQIGLIGLRCPLVLVALLGKPLHQKLFDGDGGRNQKRSVYQFMFDLFFAVYCLLFRGKTFPFVAVFTLLVLVSIADAIGAAAFRNICHTLSPFSSCPEPRIEAVFRDADASADPKNTKFGSAVAQIVGRAQADGQHLCDLLHRVHQCCGFQAVSRRLV